MKIFCVGRNYGEHARELNNAIPEAPVIFMKPPTAILKGHDFYMPDFSKDMHFECELVFRICKTGKHIAPAFASKYIDGITVGIDFTARDVQAEQKKKGLPWEIAKAFDQSAVVGTMQTLSDITQLSTATFHLQKNGVTVQQGNAADMLFPVSEVIAYLSTYFTLQQGDLLFTGTPAGVGPVAIGDVLEGYLENEKLFTTYIK